MRIERTTDPVLILSVVTHPAIYPHISDDSAPAAERFVPPIGDGLYWLAAWEGEALAGAFFLHPWNGITFEVHTCILPEFRGAKSRAATSAMLAWMFTQTHCEKVVTHVPAINQKALRLARDSGLKDEGVNRQSFKLNNQIFDQHLLGITREEWKSCH